MGGVPVHWVFDETQPIYFRLKPAGDTITSDYGVHVTNLQQDEIDNLTASAGVNIDYTKTLQMTPDGTLGIQFIPYLQ